MAAIAAAVYAHGGDLCCVQPQQLAAGVGVALETIGGAQSSPLRQQQQQQHQQPLSPAVLFAYPQQQQSGASSLGGGGGGSVFSFSPTMLSGPSLGVVVGGGGGNGGGAETTAHSPKLGRLLSGAAQQLNKENATPGSPSTVVASSPRLLQQHLQHCHQQQHFSPRMLDGGGGGGGGGGGASAPPTCSPFMSSAGYKHGNYFRFPDVQMADGGNNGGSSCKANTDATSECEFDANAMYILY